MAKKIPPTVFTIFGITGDLSKKYLLTALQSLAARGELPDEFYLVGFGRREWDSAELRAFITETLKADVPKLTANAHYVIGNFATPQDYAALGARLTEIAGARSNKIFYVATAPLYYAEIFKQLGRAKLPNSRILIEKPFGTDAKSAAALNKILHKSFTEDQIFRVDHYLAKLPIQNILTFRFGNGMFERIWNAQHIDNIQISAVMEDIGIEGRGAFYDETGALLDVVQNHILQMVALVCMDAPYNMDAECIHRAKAAVLKKVRISQEPADVVRGQYRGYTRERDVTPKSNTETFVALKLFVDTPRFRGVPIYVRTGKALDRRYTDVLVQFKQDSVHFLGSHGKAHELRANVLSIRVQPEESISLRIMVRRPGFALELAPAQMDFCYTSVGGAGVDGTDAASPSAYEKVMYDAMHGDQMSHVRSDVLMQQWRIIGALQAKWHRYPLEVYAQGSDGPASQHALVKRGGTKWWSDGQAYCPVPQTLPKKK